MEWIKNSSTQKCYIKSGASDGIRRKHSIAGEGANDVTPLVDPTEETEETDNVAWLVEETAGLLNEHIVEYKNMKYKNVA